MVRRKLIKIKKNQSYGWIEKHPCLFINEFNLKKIEENKNHKFMVIFLINGIFKILFLPFFVLFEFSPIL